MARNVRYRNPHRGDNIAMGCFGLWFLFCLAMAGGVGYIIIHFVAKYW